MVAVLVNPTDPTVAVRYETATQTGNGGGCWE